MDPRIERVFREVLEDRNLEVTEALSPANTPSWDSFAQVKIIIALEEEFGVNFTIDEVAYVANAGDLVRSLREKGAVDE